MLAIGPRCSRLAFCLLGVLGAFAPVAIPHARAERSSVLVYGANDAAESAERLASAITDALASERIEAVDAFAQARDHIRSGAVTEAELIGFARAQELMEEGWRSYLEVRPSFAAARLAQGRTESLAVAHLQGGTSLLAELSLRLGATKLDLDRAAEAADDFRLSYALAPDRIVSDSEFKPEVVIAFEAAIAQERSWQRRPLQLRPADAEIELDGKRAAVNGDELLMQDGLHLVSAVKPGYRGTSQLVSVSAGVDAPLVVELEARASATRALRGPASMARGVPESDARQAASAVLLYGQVDSLVLVASIWRQGQPALLGQLCAGQPAQCTRVVELGYPEGSLLVAASELWRSLRTTRGQFPPTLQNDARLQLSTRGPVEGPVKTRSWLANRWLWLGVAAASVTGVAIYLLGDDTELRPIFVGEGCNFGGC